MYPCVLAMNVSLGCVPRAAFAGLSLYMSLTQLGIAKWFS